MTAAAADEFKNEGFTFIMQHPGWLKTDMGGQAAPLDVSVGVEGIIKVHRCIVLFQVTLIVRSWTRPLGRIMASFTVSMALNSLGDDYCTICDSNKETPTFESFLSNICYPLVSRSV